MFELTLANPASFVISAGGVPLSSYDIALHVQDGVCDGMTPMELACADDVGSSRPEQIAQADAPAGTYYVVVDGSDTSDAGNYLLTVETGTCGDGSKLEPVEECDDMNTMDGDGCSSTCTCEPIMETEMNDDYTAASALGAGICLASGSVGVSGDDDYFSVMLAQGETITVEAVAGGADTCGPSGNIDTEIEIYDTDGTTSLAFNDDIGSSNYCSRASATAAAAGTYFVRVAASTQYCANCTFDYGMTIGIQ